MRPPILPMAALLSLATSLHAQTVHDFGDPDAREQSYIERINRARANPGGEAQRLVATTHPGVRDTYRFASVNLTVMQAEITALPVCPPLVPDARLMAAARGHVQWMHANAQQAHDQPGGKTFLQRLEAEAYPYAFAAENVFAYAEDEEYAHASFEVDWAGPGFPGAQSQGMQNPRSHRLNIHSGQFREIGIGNIIGSNTSGGYSVGPELVTQDFAVRGSYPADARSFGTGVAYYDLDGDNAYDAGEGIAGLAVAMQGSSHTCNTARGGGWVVPVESAAAATNRVVTFTGPGMNRQIVLGFPGGVDTNVKGDLQLSYTPPVFTSAAEIPAGVPHTAAITPVEGATSHLIRYWDKIAAGTETCDASTNVIPSTSGAYAFVNQAIRDGSGGASFHLMNPNGSGNQSFEFKDSFHGDAGAALSFMSRVRVSSAAEYFKVQVREEGMAGWVDVYSQRGGGTAEAAFSLRNISLGAMAGKVFRLRFVLEYSAGTYWPYTGDGYGWFIDTIGFANIHRLGQATAESWSGTTGSINPSATDGMILLAQPVISGRAFPGGSQVVGIIKSPALVSLGSLRQTYDGTAKAATVTTDPGNLPCTVTYNGSTTVPVAVGTYQVEAKVRDVFYSGTATGVMEITLPEVLRNGDMLDYSLADIPMGGGTSMTVTGLPAGLVFNPATRMLSGVITGNAGTYAGMIRIYNGRTLVRSQSLPMVVQPFPPSMVGSYELLVESADGPQGMVRVSVASSALWTGTLRLSGQPARTARGKFALSPGRAAATISAVFPATKSAPQATVVFGIDAASSLVAGTCAHGQVQATTRGFRLAKGPGLPPAARRFTIVFDPVVAGDGETIPGGTGWATGSVGTNGVITATATLGDARKVSFSCGLSATGQAVVWLQPYRQLASYFGGVITLGNFGQSGRGLSSESVADGLRWFRAADAAEPGYPGGFAAQSLIARTSRWNSIGDADDMAGSLGLDSQRRIAVTAVAEPSQILPQWLGLQDNFSLRALAPAHALPWTNGSMNRGQGTFAARLGYPTGAAEATGVFLQDESFGLRVGAGLIKVNKSSGLATPPFRTVGLLFTQSL